MSAKRLLASFVVLFVLALCGLPAHAAITPSGPPPAGSQEIGSDMTVVAIDGPKWTVIYGVDKRWASITGSGVNVVQCAPGTFGGDPAPGVAKKCFAIGQTNGAYSCATDLKSCAYSGDGRVIYGVSGKLVSLDVKGAGSLVCQPATFKTDPAPNVAKNCFFMAQTPAERAAAAAAAAAAGKAQAEAAAAKAKLDAIANSPQPPAGAQEIGSDMTLMAIDGPKWTVFYGADKRWASITGSGLNVVQCAPATFGGDPASGVAKKCFVTGQTNSGVSCAADLRNCAYSGDGRVIYGVNGKVVSLDVKGAGSLVCQPGTFKTDPAPNVAKNCFFMAQTPAERTAAAAAAEAAAAKARLAAIANSPPPPAGALEFSSDVAVDGPKWTVFYGAGNAWTSITGSGVNVVQCTLTAFSGDPAPNVAKKCFVSGHTNSGASCAADQRNCAYSGDGRVIYGVNGKVASLDVKGAGSLVCQPSTFTTDPAPNVAKNCFFMAQTPAERAAAVAAAAAAKPPKTPTDPVAWIIDQAKKRKSTPAAAVAVLDTLLGPTKGVFLMEDSEEDDAKPAPGEIIGVKGKFNWVRGLAATQGPASGLLRMAKNMSSMAKVLGVSETVPLEVTLFYRGNELDLEFAFKLFDGWKMTGELVPVAKTRVAFKELSLKLHAKLAGKIPEFSVEGEGVGFAQATSKDSWVLLSPAVELNNEGEVTFGGAFSGTCEKEPNKDTKSEDCKGDWDVFKMGRITAKGGSLRVTMLGEAPKGFEATILNARLGKPGQLSGIEVTGAVRSAVKLKPGFGLVLQTRGKPKLKDFVNAFYGPFLAQGGTLNPMRVLVDGFDKLPNPELPLSQEADIIITPTGFVLENFNYPDPLVYIKAQAAAAGIQINIDSNIKGDVDKILAGDISGGLPNGYFTVSENNTGFNQGVKDVASKVPGGGTVVGFIMDHGFTFNSVSATVTFKGLERSGAASVTYKLGGTERSIDNIPIASVSDPTALPLYVLETLARNLTDPPQWLKDIPGVGDAAVLAGQGLRSALGLAGSVVGGAKSVATAAVQGLISLFGGGGRDNTQDLLNQHVSPFGPRTTVITCASEGQRCVVDGTQTVVYGADSRTVSRTVTGSIDCTNNAFGRDPASGTPKSCYYSLVNPPGQFSIMCALENQRCALPQGAYDVAYGAGTRVLYKRGASGTLDCTNTNFGSDPAPGSVKGCYYRASDLKGVKCAEEDGTCSVDSNGPAQDVYYGGADTYTVLTCRKGPVQCQNGTFGRDPAQQLRKACYRVPAAGTCS